MPEPINHIQSIASNPRHIRDSAFDVGPGIPSEAVEAGVAVGEGGADPSQGVAHLPLERLGAQVLQLVEAPPQLVDGVRNLFITVAQRGALALAHGGSASMRKCMEEFGGPARVGQAYPQSCPGHV